MDPVNTPGVPGQSEGSDPNVDWKAQYEAEKQARAASDKRYSELRSFSDRKIGDLTQKIAQRPEPQGGNGNWDNSYEEPQRAERPRSPSTGQFLPARDERGAFQQAKYNVAMDLIMSGQPGWQEEYNAALTFIQDPVNAEQVSTFGGDGLIDYQRSLTNAIREVRLQKYTSGQSAQSNPNANQDARAAAVISGQGGSDIDRTVNFDNMSADDFKKEIVRSGAYDHSDPPSFAKSLQGRPGT